LDRDEPSDWPIYRLNPSVKVKTGDIVPRSGVYLSDIDGSSAQFLIAEYKAWQASIPDPPADPRVASAASKDFDATWTLVERIADSGGSVAGLDDAAPYSMKLRCESGQPCPKAGWWMTPSRENSRRKFERGDIMPSTGGDYGVTIWQWDAHQGI
jgi:hypothetical protein